MNIETLVIVLLFGLSFCISTFSVSSILCNPLFLIVPCNTSISLPNTINSNLNPNPILSLNKTYYIAKIDQNTGYAYLYTAEGKPVSTTINNHIYYLVYFNNTTNKELNLYYLGNKSIPDPTKNTPITYPVNLPLYSYAKLMSSEDKVLITPLNIKTYIDKGNKIILNGGYTENNISDNNVDVTAFIKSL